MQDTLVEACLNVVEARLRGSNVYSLDAALDKLQEVLQSLGVLKWCVSCGEIIPPDDHSHECVVCGATLCNFCATASARCPNCIGEEEQSVTEEGDQQPQPTCRVCGIELSPDTSGGDLCEGCRQQRVRSKVRQLVADGPSGWETLARMLFETDDPAAASMTAKMVAECLLRRAETGACAGERQCPLSARIRNVGHGCISWELYAGRWRLRTSGVCGVGEFTLREDGCDAACHLIGLYPIGHFCHRGEQQQREGGKQ